MASAGEGLFATAEEVRSLAERALTVLEENAGYDFDAPKEEIRARNIRFWAARETMRFCAAAAALTADPSLIPDLVSLFDAQSEFDDDCGYLDATARGIGELVRVVAGPNADVRDLARHAAAILRLQVAQYLRPTTGDAALQLLDALADDPSPEVRQAARAALEPVRPVPWWRGKFARDPFVTLAPAEAKQHAKRLAEISAILDKPWYEMGKEIPALTKLVAGIPPALALELSEQLLNATDFWSHNEPPDLLTLVLTLPGGEEAFLRILQRWVTAEGSGTFMLRRLATGAVAAAPRETRLRFCERLVAWALPRAFAGDDFGARYADHFLAEVLKGAWPTDADASRMLDALLALPAPEGHFYNYFVSTVQTVIAESRLPQRTLRAALAAKCDGLEGAWKNRNDLATRLAARVPPRVARPAVMKLLEGDGDGDGDGDGEKLRWALETWIARCYDEARDGRRSQLAERIWAEPRWRQAALASYEQKYCILAPLRRALRAGTATFREAVTAMEMIRVLYGGVCDERGVPPDDDDDEILAKDEDPEARRRETREEHRAWLGPRSLQGPPTEIEWANYRAARERTPPVEPRDWQLALDVMPPGPWSARDREVFDRAFALHRAAEDSRLDLALAECLAAHGDVADLALFQTLQECASRRDGAVARRFVTGWQKYAHKRLGVPLPTQPARDGGPAAASPTGDGSDGDGDEWMDQDDDEL